MGHARNFLDLKAKADPFLFRLSPDASKDEIVKASKRLISQLKPAISLCVSNHTEVIRQATPFPAATEKDGPGRFRPNRNPIGTLWDNVPFGETETPIHLADGPILWLRVMPAFAVDRTFPAYELKSRGLYGGNIGLQPISPGSSMFGVRGDDGYGLCSLYPPTNDRTTPLAFAFESGEVWGADTELLNNRIIPFVEPIYAERLKDFARVLKNLGVEPPYRWECGMAGVKGFRLHVPVPSGRSRIGDAPKCSSETIRKEGSFDGVESPQKALLPFFKEILIDAENDRQNTWRVSPCRY